jgi:hypothetical protein
MKPIWQRATMNLWDRVGPWARSFALTAADLHHGIDEELWEVEVDSMSRAEGRQTLWPTSGMASRGASPLAELAG